VLVANVANKEKLSIEDAGTVELTPIE